MSPALEQLVGRALAEDVGHGDMTTEAIVPPAARARGRIIQKEPGVIFGLDAAAEAFMQTGAVTFDRLTLEGKWRDEVPADVATVTGKAAPLLAGERTALNFLGHLSGVATLANRFATAVSGTAAVILDTRKTIPGLRELEKAAVAAGGATNHRLGLGDAILIKENHLAVAGSVGDAIARARENRAGVEIEVECSTAAEVDEALAAGAGRILLDNMDLTELSQAVAARNAAGAATKLEASGGITLENVAEVAATGVDFISVGAITHSAPALDVSMLLEAA
jgi:nicotinate-nucleotide pyrophosphorylase (carboxylating)